MAVAHELAQAESRQSLEELFWAHHKRVLRAAYRITGNMADAEDVAQSVFMRLAGPENTRIESAESYLYRAAINGALDLIRRRQAGREVELGVATHLAISGPSSSPERELANGELGRRLREALASLKGRSAEMFVLRYIEGLDNREIARMLGTSRAVVAVMLHQAKAKLRKKFEEQTRGIR